MNDRRDDEDYLERLLAEGYELSPSRAQAELGAAEPVSPSPEQVAQFEQMIAQRLMAHERRATAGPHQSLVLTPKKGLLERLMKAAACVAVGALLSGGAAMAIIASKQAEMERELIAARQAMPLPATPEEGARQGLDAMRRIEVHTTPDAPGTLTLGFSPFVQPPYCGGARIEWGDGTDDDWVYQFGAKPLEPFKKHVYALPVSGERQVRAKVQFILGAEGRRHLRRDSVIEELPLVLSPSGVRVASTADSAGVNLAILSPAPRATVSDPFELVFTVSAPRRTGPLGEGITHVLVRPLDGEPAETKAYYLVPFHRSVRESIRGEQQYRVWVPLGALLGLDAIEESKRPTRYEVVVVELPFLLQAWFLPAAQVEQMTAGAKATRSEFLMKVDAGRSH